MPPTSSSVQSPSAASPASGCVTGTMTVWMAQMNLPTAVRSLCGEEGVGLATPKPGPPPQLGHVCVCLPAGRRVQAQSLQVLRAVGDGGGGSAWICPTEILLSLTSPWRTA